MTPTDKGEPEDCHAISEILARIGDKWTLLVVELLADGPMRFNEIRRTIGNISQRMLTLTVRGLERDGLVTRTVYPTIPPRVEYELTKVGTHAARTRDGDRQLGEKEPAHHRRSAESVRCGRYREAQPSARAAPGAGAAGQIAQDVIDTPGPALKDKGLSSARPDRRRFCFWTDRLGLPGVFVVAGTASLTDRNRRPQYRLLVAALDRRRQCAGSFHEIVGLHLKIPLARPDLLARPGFHLELASVAPEYIPDDRRQDNEQRRALLRGLGVERDPCSSTCRRAAYSRS